MGGFAAVVAGYNRHSGTSLAARMSPNTGHYAAESLGVQEALRFPGSA